MTTHDSESAAVLLVVDMQHDVLAGAWHADDVTARVAGLVDRARLAGVPVVWVRHSSDAMPVGSDGWQLVPALVPATGEAVVEKRYGDSFEATNLTEVLVALKTETVVVCGAQSDACVISTLFGGFTRGYDMTLVGDAHTTDDYSAYGLPGPEGVIALINGIWAWRTAPGRRADVITSDAWCSEPDAAPSPTPGE